MAVTAYTRKPLNSAFQTPNLSNVAALSPIKGDQTNTLAQQAQQGYTAQAANTLNPYANAQQGFQAVRNFSRNGTDYTKQAVETAKGFQAEHDAWAQREQQRQEAAKAAQEAAQAAQQQSSSQVSSQPQQQGGAGYDSSDYTGLSDPRQQIVKAAYSELGTPYAWGGGGYHNSGSRGIGLGTQNVIGVDCSGLTSYAYGTVGIQIPRYSKSQTTLGYRTSIDNLKPGDLVGWYDGNGGVRGHISVYVGNGYIIESPHPGAYVRKRKLYGSEGAFGVHIKMPGE